MIRAMVDIETLGSPPFALLLECAVVRNDGAEPVQVIFDMQDQPRRRMDASTIAWWQTQPDAWAAAMRRQADAVPFRVGLLAVARALSGLNEVWANSPSFDLETLSCAMRQCRVRPTWKYWQERDFRTARALNPGVDYTPPIAAHGALADATAQADHLAKLGIWRA